MSKQRCSGHCCNKVWQAIGPSELAAMAEAKRNGKGSFVLNGKTIRVINDPDLGYIANMLTFLQKAKPAGYYYTCRHL